MSTCLGKQAAEAHVPNTKSINFSCSVNVRVEYLLLALSIPELLWGHAWCTSHASLLARWPVAHLRVAVSCRGLGHMANLTARGTLVGASLLPPYLPQTI